VGDVHRDGVRVPKVVAYVTRGDALLVFRHRDLPLVEVGLQVPAGTIEHGEPPQEAAAREVEEETGLTGLLLAAYLGAADYDVRPGRPEVHERHFFHFIAPPETPDEWTWHEEHDGLQEPTTFSYFWLPLRNGHVLSAGFGVRLAEVRA
jgi:8-oxo-dGTP pyrophosphatase MutT (NUDIX family)